MTEFEWATQLADRLLNEPNADPDDDLRTLARQFWRANERAEAAEQSLAEAQNNVGAAIAAEVAHAMEAAAKICRGVFDDVRGTHPEYYAACSDCEAAIRQAIPVQPPKGTPS